MREGNFSQHNPRQMDTTLGIIPSGSGAPRLRHEALPAKLVRLLSKPMDPSGAPAAERSDGRIYRGPPALCCNHVRIDPAADVLALPGPKHYKMNSFGWECHALGYGFEPTQ